MNRLMLYLSYSAPSWRPFSPKDFSSWSASLTRPWMVSWISLAKSYSSWVYWGVPMSFMFRYRISSRVWLTRMLEQPFSRWMATWVPVIMAAPRAI